MSIDACARLVERGDPDRFLSVMAAPVAVRARLFPLYAFNLEVARAPWVTREPMIAEMRLQWWRDVLEEIASGAAVRSHEVVTPLAEVIDPPTARLLEPLIEARRWDIEGQGFASETDLACHIDAGAGTLMWAAARTLGAPVEIEPVVRDFAQGAGLANWLLAIPDLERAGKKPLLDGRPGAVQTLAREGLRRLSHARRSRHAVPRSVAPALLAGWLATPILRQAAAQPIRVSNGTLGLSEARRRLTLLFRSSTGRW